MASLTWGSSVGRKRQFMGNMAEALARRGRGRSATGQRSRMGWAQARVQRWPARAWPGGRSW